MDTATQVVALGNRQLTALYEFLGTIKDEDRIGPNTYLRCGTREWTALVAACQDHQ